ncbi:MAG: hypothetical protein MdMp014T_1617 [Treponematales bacterium]
MTIYQAQEAQRKFENIRNIKRRRNGEAPVTEADLQGEDWEMFRDTGFTVGEARRWMEYGAELRERFPGDESLDDVVERLLQAERADQKIREYLETANERKRKANEFVDVFGNRRRSIWGDGPQELPGAWGEPAPVKWTPERRVWG